MNKLSKDQQTKLAIVIVGGLVILGLLYYFGVDAQKTKLAAITKEATATKDKTDNAESLLKKKASIKESRDRDTDELALIEESMAPADRRSWFLPLLNDFIQPYKGIALIKDDVKENTRPLGMIPNFPYRAASFHVQMTAFYVDFGRFLADFENKYPYFFIENLEMLPTASPTDEKEKLDVKFDVVTPIKPNVE